MTLPTEYRLNNGHTMPAFGLGTWGSQPEDHKHVKEAVKAALEAGYRHIDCAFVYENEEVIGEVFSNLPAGLTRKDIYVTSKLWNTCHRPENVRMQLEHSLKSLKLEYLDNFIIHWPVSFEFQGLEKLTPRGPNKEVLFDRTVSLQDTWRALEACVDAGLVRSIGLSNFNIARTKEILAIARIKPANLQVELHPYLPQDELRAFCRDQGIVVTAYSPLGTDREPKLMQDPVVKAVAEKHAVHPAHILISWHLNRGDAVIPKSSNPQRLRDNLQQLIQLDASDMAELAKLKERNVRYVCPERMWNVTIFDSL